MQNKANLVLVVFTVITSIAGTSIIKPQLNPKKVNNLLILYKLNNISTNEQKRLIKKLKQASPTTQKKLYQTIINSFPKTLLTKETKLKITSNVSNFWGKIKNLSLGKKQNKIHDFTVMTLLSLLENTTEESTSSGRENPISRKKSISKKKQQRVLNNFIQNELKEFQNDFYPDTISSS